MNLRALEVNKEASTMLTTYTRLLAERKLYSTPRDITCWYCQRGRHTDCFSKKLCACRVCLAIHDHKETK